MKKVLIALTALAMPLAVSAQSVSTVEDLGQTDQQKTVSASELEATASMTPEEKAYRDNFVKDLEEAGKKINENAEVWAEETARRGYPKKKTVKEKAELVDHYIFLLSTQLSDSRLNRFIDKQKVQDKITYWQNYREQLNKLM